MKFLLRFFGFLFAAGTILFIVGIAAVAGLLWHYSKDLPDYSQLAGLRAAGDDAGACRRRLAARRIRQRAAPLSADPGGAEARHQRLHRGRGQEFLRASRHRHSRHRPRRAALRAELRQQPPPAGRLDHHPAGREELPAHQRGVLRAARSRKRCWRCASSAPIRRTRSSSSISTRFISASAPTASPRRRCSISTSRCTS